MSWTDVPCPHSSRARLAGRASWATTGAGRKAAIGARASTASTLSARPSADDALYAQAATSPGRLDRRPSRSRRGRAARVRAIARASGARVDGRRGPRAPAVGEGCARTASSSRRRPPGGRRLGVRHPVSDATARALAWAIAALAAFALVVLLAGHCCNRRSSARCATCASACSICATSARPAGRRCRARPIAELADGVDGVAKSLADLASQAATDPLLPWPTGAPSTPRLGTELARAKRQSSSLDRFDFPTSTASRRSTTATATRSATTCCARGEEAPGADARDRRAGPDRRRRVRADPAGDAAEVGRATSSSARARRRPSSSRVSG